MTKKAHNIGWAAGFLEGEGCFSLIKKPGSRPGTGSIRIVVEQTEEEPLLKLQELFGGKIYGPYIRANRGKNIKPLWIYKINGEIARSLAIAVLPYMFSRRTAQINYILKNLPDTIIKKGVKGEKLNK